MQQCLPPVPADDLRLRVERLATELDRLAGDPALEPRLVTRVHDLAKVARSLGREPTDTRLTRRESQVVRLLAAGHTMPQAASLLGITPRTVAFHKYRAMEALGARSSAELVGMAIRQGLA